MAGTPETVTEDTHSVTAPTNIHEYSVSELSGAIKRSIEDNFGFVRVRGELGRVSRPQSGHVYLDLKDEKSVINGVIWKGVAGRLRIAPEQGMEVIATGKLTTFPGQSRYQIIIDGLEPAGVGALMALFEERKKKLAAEGLFAQERKKPLPFLPDVIGVATSPSGAVIRDILHRLRDRFPRHVLVWPTPVQGQGAEAKIAEAIAGFNALPIDGDVPRPDVLIVARGGGSLEDLWCFNEEAVARAAAASAIPLISAVGHETDTTLIDFVADRRAPTPTAAAEIAVPVRTDLQAQLLDKERRLVSTAARAAERRRTALTAAARGLGKPEDFLGPQVQRLDRASDRLAGALRARLDRARARLAAMRLAPAALDRRRRDGAEALARLWTRAAASRRRALERRGERLSSASNLLRSLSYQNVLERGFALVRDAQGGVLRSAKTAPDGAAVSIRFADGDRGAVLGKGGDASKAQRSTPGAIGRPESGHPKQASLFDES